MKLRHLASNMTELEFNGNTVLFSYETPVACNFEGEFYKTDCRWSQTTTRHINKWLDGVNAEYRPQSFFDELVS